MSIDNTTLQKGDIKQLSITILPKEAENNEIEFTSSNPNVVTVDEKGKLQAIHSGSSIIKVKALENDVQNEIEINVYSKTIAITLDQEKIYMQVGDVFQINSYIEPDDASNPEVIYQSSNIEVAEIAQNGVITAKQIGETDIVAMPMENSDIQAKCKVFVVRKMEDTEIHFDSSLTINSLEISGIDKSENTVSDIKNKIITDLDIEIVNYANQALENTDKLGTGSKIRIKEDDKVLREYQIIIYGDANGDGKINSIDLLVLQRHILEIETIDPIFKKACNISKNGKKPTSVDLLLIQRHILNLQVIEQ